MRTLEEFIKESSKKLCWRQYYESICDFFNENLDTSNIDINISIIWYGIMPDFLFMKHSNI